MRNFVRVEFDGDVHYAELRDGMLHFLNAAPWLGGVPTGGVQPESAARRLRPCTPSKILAVGKNYSAHAKEMGGEAPTYPLIFMKPSSSLVDPGDPVILPRESARVDYEGELAVIIGRRARKVPSTEALDYVFGYTAACDITARDLQHQDGQWTRAKGFDTFCPLAPAISSEVDVSAASLTTHVNGELKQNGNTRDMVFSVAQVVEFISGVMTLEPGDVILTGTPEGIGPLAAGDLVDVQIGSLARLSFAVQAG